MDNFLYKGLEQRFLSYKANVDREIAELVTAKGAVGQDFQQQTELLLTRENHAAVMHELKRMQDEPGYVSTWMPRMALKDENEAKGQVESPRIH